MTSVPQVARSASFTLSSDSRLACLPTQPSSADVGTASTAWAVRPDWSTISAGHPTARLDAGDGVSPDSQRTVDNNQLHSPDERAAAREYGLAAHGARPLARRRPSATASRTSSARCLRWAVRGPGGRGRGGPRGQRGGPPDGPPGHAADDPAAVASGGRAVQRPKCMAPDPSLPRQKCLHVPPSPLSRASPSRAPPVRRSASFQRARAAARERPQPARPAARRPDRRAIHVAVVAAGVRRGE